MLCDKIEEWEARSVLGEGLSEKLTFEHRPHYREGSSNGHNGS